MQNRVDFTTKITSLFIIIRKNIFPVKLSIKFNSRLNR